MLPVSVLPVSDDPVSSELPPSDGVDAASDGASTGVEESYEPEELPEEDDPPEELAGVLDDEEDELLPDEDAAGVLLELEPLDEELLGVEYE